MSEQQTIPQAQNPKTQKNTSLLFDDTFLPERGGATHRATQNEVFSIERERAQVGQAEQSIFE